MMHKPILGNFDIDAIPAANKFGAKRKHDFHTGIDLFAPAGTQVFAIEDGIVTDVSRFTGASIGTPWWNETCCVAVEGASGVILYAELKGYDPTFSREKEFANLSDDDKIKGVPLKYHHAVKYYTPDIIEKVSTDVSKYDNDIKVKVGDSVKEGQLLGYVKPVLMKDKGLPMSMLHIELYETGYRGNWDGWWKEDEKPAQLKSMETILKTVYNSHNHVKIGDIISDGGGSPWIIDDIWLQPDCRNWQITVYPPGKKQSKFNKHIFVYSRSEFDKLQPMSLPDDVWFNEHGKMMTTPKPLTRIQKIKKFFRWKM